MRDKEVEGETQIRERERGTPSERKYTASGEIGQTKTLAV